MKVIYILVLLSLLASGCSQRQEEASNDVIVSVYDQSLTVSELNKNIPQGITKEDSVITAENYIKFWIHDVLLYDVAKKNIANKEEIEELIENYKRSLIIYHYQEQLIQEKLSKNISKEEISKYYMENANVFKLEISLLKGFLLKLPTDAPQVKNVKEWSKSNRQQDLEKLDKYIVKNAVSFDDFQGHWIDWDTVNEKLPKNELSAVTLKEGVIELQDSAFIYILNVQSYLSPGNTAPEEFAEKNIREILINQKKIEFLRKLEEDLYNEALKEGKIKFGTLREEKER